MHVIFCPRGDSRTNERRGEPCTFQMVYCAWYNVIWWIGVGESGKVGYVRMVEVESMEVDAD